MRKYWPKFFCALDFSRPRTHSYYKYRMKIIYTILSLAPAPTFFLGFLYSIYAPSPMCGHDYSMTVMWLTMSLAHTLPWFLRWQQRNFTRN